MKRIFISAAIAALIKAEGEDDSKKTDATDEVKANLEDPKFDDFKPNWSEAQKAMDDAVAALATESSKIVYDPALATAKEEAEAALETYLTIEGTECTLDGFTDGKKVYTQKSDINLDKVSAQTQADDLLTGDVTTTDVESWTCDGAATTVEDYDKLDADGKAKCTEVFAKRAKVEGDLQGDDATNYAALKACGTSIQSWEDGLTDLATLKAAVTDAEAAIEQKALDDTALTADVLATYNGVVATDEGLTAGTVAELTAQFVAKENVFMMSHVTILKGAAEGDAEMQSASARWTEYSVALAEESVLWEALKALDQAVVTDKTAGTSDEDKKAKADAEARIAGYDMSLAALKTWDDFVKAEGKAKATLENTDAADDDAVSTAVDFNAARTAYVEAYITSTLALATQAASEAAADSTDKAALDLYAEFMGLEQEVAKQNAEAAAGEASGGMGWIFGLLAGAAALGGGYFAYKKCKGGDDKEDN